MPVAFSIKMLIGILLFILHIQTYGIGELSHDGETFLREASYLNQVFFTSPKDYFQLLFGIGDTKKLITEHLHMTQYWSAGDLTLINDSRNTIRFHSVIHFISGNSHYVHLSVICFIGLLSVKNVYLIFSPYIQQSKTFTFWVLFLVPSTLFWTSSLLKEPLLFLGLTFLLRGIIVEKNSTKRSLFSVFGILFALSFKPYVFACLLVAFIFLASYQYLFRKYAALTAGVFFVIATTLFLLFPSLVERPVHYLTRKQFDFENVGKGGLHVVSDSCFYYFEPHQYTNLAFHGDSVKLLRTTDALILQFGSIQKPIPIHLLPSTQKWKIYYQEAGCRSYIPTTPIQNSTLQLLKNIPEALINSAIRPFPSDPGSNLKYLSLLEVWLIFAFLLFALARRRKLAENEKSAILGLLVFAMLLFLVIGWTTPVLGAITRYRFPAQFALIVVGLILLKPIKWKKTKNISL